MATQYEAAVKKRLSLSSILIFLVVPALIATSVYLGRRWYLITSIAILLAIMSPFFMIFERRKPKAREIVLIAMMSALVVRGHLVLHLVFPVQIGTALVIISGIALGPEAGFLIGALSRFVCNFYMGQGAWTPWQMFCWGLLGFLAGLAFNRISINHNQDLNEGIEAVEKRRLGAMSSLLVPLISIVFFEIIAYTSILFFPDKEAATYEWRFYAFGLIGIIVGAVLQRNKLPAEGITMAIFTFLTTFLIYGGIMNFAALVTSMAIPGADYTNEFGNEINWTAIKTIYITGLPYDLMHGFTAALCVFFFGEPMIKKLERIKIKYGIYK